MSQSQDTQAIITLDDEIIDDLILEETHNFEEEFKTGITEESADTAVIYRLTNNSTSKFYIGKTISYTINGVRKGADGRFGEHFNKAKYQLNKGLPFDCPNFYPIILNTKKEDWTVEILLIVPKNDQKRFETMAIKHFRSHIDSIGYNYLIADNKPIDGNNAINYVNRKVFSNRNRARDGAMKRNNDGLPANIYKRQSGYFVQIRINGEWYNKLFSSKIFTWEEKLELAKQFLTNIKTEHGLI